MTQFGNSTSPRLVCLIVLWHRNITRMVRHPDSHVVINTHELLSPVVLSSARLQLRTILCTLAYFSVRTVLYALSLIVFYTLVCKHLCYSIRHRPTPDSECPRHTSPPVSTVPQRPHRPPITATVQVRQLTVCGYQSQLSVVQ